jgi:hypothetical protein
MVRDLFGITCGEVSVDFFLEFLSFFGTARKVLGVNFAGIFIHFRSPHAFPRDRSPNYVSLSPLFERDP